jgi:hypothetical protein
MAYQRRPTGWVVRRPPVGEGVAWRPMWKRPTKNEIVYESSEDAEVRADALNQRSPANRLDHVAIQKVGGVAGREVGGQTGV